jgi:hypothetical protein
MWDLDTIKRQNRAEPLRLEQGFQWPTKATIPFMESTDHLPESLAEMWVDMSGFRLEGSRVLTISQTGVALRDLVEEHGAVKVAIIAVERAAEPHGLLAVWEG